MKDKVLIVKVDDEFSEKLEFVKKVNGYKSKSETVRKLVYKEYMIYILEGLKEKEDVRK